MRISGITYVSRKTSKVKSTFKFLIFLIITAAVFVSLISSFNAWKILHPSRQSIVSFDSSAVPEYEDITFNDIKDEISLKGWLFQSPGSRKTIILAHGYGRNRLQFGTQTFDLIKGFLSKGYNVITFDFRNSGNSSGKISTLGYNERYDVLGAVRYAKLQGARDIALLGFDTGAVAALLAAAESDIEESRDIDAIIADSLYTDMNQYILNRLPNWYTLDFLPMSSTTLWFMNLFSKVNPTDVSLAKAVETTADFPLLFIHSKGDILVSIEDVRVLYGKYSSAPARVADFWEIEGSSHAESYLDQPQDYLNKILNFLK